MLRLWDGVEEHLSVTSHPCRWVQNIQPNLACVGRISNKSTYTLDIDHNTLPPPWIIFGCFFYGDGGSKFHPSWLEGLRALGPNVKRERKKKNLKFDYLRTFHTYESDICINKYISISAKNINM